MTVTIKYRLPPSERQLERLDGNCRLRTYYSKTLHVITIGGVRALSALDKWNRKRAHKAGNELQLVRQGECSSLYESGHRTEPVDKPLLPPRG